MNIKSVHFAPELQTIMGKIYDEGSLSLLRIDIGLNPDGAGLSIGANGGMVSWTNYVMAEGWLEKFAVDLAAVLQEDKNFNALLEQRLEEFLDKAGKKCAEDLRGEK